MRNTVIIFFLFLFSLHETEIHKENHRLEPIYRSEMFLDRDYCMSQGASYNYLDPNYFPANRWHGKQMATWKLRIFFKNRQWHCCWFSAHLGKTLAFLWNVNHSMRASQAPSSHYCSLVSHDSRSLNRGWTFLVCGRFDWGGFSFTTLVIFWVVNLKRGRFFKNKKSVARNEITH